ncbi:unnamed protein product [Amoebophrya sp. A25]|nr:unnamed protein product [Amoebophrya sp. A25]|eukprot:GSA25T00006449001.1
MLYRLVTIEELEVQDCVVKIHVKEDDTHELDFIEVIDDGDAEPPEFEDTVDWNEEAMEELERGVRRAVEKEFGPKKIVPKDLTMVDSMAKVCMIWRSARSGVPLYYGAEKCAAPELRFGKVTKDSIQVKFFIKGTPEIDPHVERFEVVVEAFDFASPAVTNMHEHFGDPDQPKFINWDYNVSSAKLSPKQTANFPEPLGSSSPSSGSASKAAAGGVQGGASSSSGGRAGGVQRQGGTTSPTASSSSKYPPLTWAELSGSGGKIGEPPRDETGPEYVLPPRKVVFSSSDIKGTDRSCTIANLRPSRVHFVRIRGCTKKWVTDWSSELKAKTHPLPLLDAFPT